MLETDPKIIVRNILRDEYDASNYGVGASGSPQVHTGWYDYNAGGQQVTLTNYEESPVGGGDTGVTASDGDGGIVIVAAGTMLLNAWAGTRDDCRGIGTGGGDVNPKEVSYQSAREAVGILRLRAEGTVDENNDPQLHSLGVGAVREQHDTDATPTVFRHECVVRVTFVEKYPSS